MKSRRDFPLQKSAKWSAAGLPTSGGPPLPTQADGLFAKLGLVLLGATCFWELRFIGAVTLTELLLGGVLLFGIPRVREFLASREAKMILALGLVWLIAQIATDYFRGSAFRDWSRGWGRITLYLINFSGFYLLLRRREWRITWVLIGLALGMLVAAALRVGSPYFRPDALWKFHVALPVTYLITALFLSRPRSLLYPVCLAAIAGVSLWLGFRSYAGVCLAAIALWCGYLWQSHQPAPRDLKPTRAWLSAVSVVGLVTAVFMSSVIAASGALGDDERFRTEQQIRRGVGLLGNHPIAQPIGLIAGGRGEFLIALRAIADSPLLGHGSWAKNFRYTDMWMALAGEENIAEIRVEQVERREPGLIPTHSHVLGAWVEAGVGGAIFWGYVLFLAYSVLALSIRTNQPHGPFLLPIFTLFIWDIFFSPLSTQSRLCSAFYLAIAACLLERWYERSKAVPR